MAARKKLFKISDQRNSFVNCAEDGYVELAKDIVQVAAFDYRAVLVWLADPPVLATPTDIRRKRHEKRELEKFFASKWCAQLSSVNGPRLAKEIRDRWGRKDDTWDSIAKENEEERR